MRSRLVIAAGLVLATSLPGAAGDREDCFGSDSSLVIEGCSAVIAGAAADDPGLPDILYRRGLALLAAGRPGEAIADFSAAIGLRPDDADAYHYRGLALSAEGAFDAAIADYTRAVELRPDFALAYHNRASAYVALGEEERAAADEARARAAAQRGSGDRTPLPGGPDGQP